MIILSIAAGLLSSVVRIVTLTIVSLFGLLRLDKPLFPNWVLEEDYKDEANGTYLSMILIYHQHNHPIQITFMNTLSFFFF